jgi:cell division septation protein DedD
MGYDTDRTFSAQQWRVVVFAACGILIAGVGLGVLVGRVTAPTPEPPPASASILPDVLPPAAAASAVPDEEPDEPATTPPVVAAPQPPAVVVKAPAFIAPEAAQAPAVTAPKPERSPSPRHIAPKIVRTPVEPPASGPRWVVQLGAFQSSDHANLLVNTLAAHGETAHVSFVRNAAGQGWFYVQTRPYRSAAAAKSAAETLATREHLPTYLVKLPDAD